MEVDELEEFEKPVCWTDPSPAQEAGPGRCVFHCLIEVIIIRIFDAGSEQAVFRKRKKTNNEDASMDQLNTEE